MLDRAVSGRWVLWRETHEWWRLPEHEGGFAYKTKPLHSSPNPDGMPDRYRRLINEAQLYDLLSVAKPSGWQESLHFPGDIVAIVKTVGGFEMELIWWET